MKPFKVASFRSKERALLKRAARELGHGLQTRPVSELASIRRELSELDEEVTESDQYSRGFLDAIEHILAGLSAELKYRGALAEEVAAARLRKNAIKVILALHSGCHLPSEIASNTGLKLPTVSSELSELAHEDIVEHAPPSRGEDQRTQPRALTVRGLQIANELTRTKISPQAEAARSLAPLFVSFINRLGDEMGLTTDSLLEIATERLGAVDGEFVHHEFIRHAMNQRLISSLAARLVTLTTPHYSRRLRDLLGDAFSSEHLSLLEPMRRLVGPDDYCLLRATPALRDPWEMALRHHGLRNVLVWCRDDARAHSLPVPHGTYHLVWENPEIMVNDRNDDGLRSYIRDARRRLCYVATDLELPPDVERIDLETHHIGR